MLEYLFKIVIIISLVGCSSLNVETLKGLNETYHPTITLINIDF